MHKALTRVLPAALVLASLSIPAAATVIPAGYVPVPIGYVSYDVTGSDLAQFDIVNLTGPNSTAPGDPTFPVLTPVVLSSLSLTVNYAGGGTRVFGSSYFTLDADGLSFDGNQLSTIAGAPTGLYGAVSATLTGVLNAGKYTLYPNGHQTGMLPTFSATISDPGGALESGDLAVLDAAAPVPEPSTGLLMGTGLLGLFGITQVRRLKARHAAYALGVGCALLLLPAASSASTPVKLNSATSPTTGASGGGSVSVTGSGFPSGAISPANVSVSVAPACAAAGTATTATSVQKVLGTTEKIQFAIPGSLTPGTYFVSISGVDSNSVSFSSGSSCSSVQVVAGPSPTLTIDTTNPVDWKISNGAMLIDFNPTQIGMGSTTSYGNIFGIRPAGTTDNLIDQTQTLPNGQPKGWYMDNSGLGTPTGIPGYVNAGSYLDWWVTYPSGASNNYTFSEHWVVTPNDFGVHIYFVLNHSTTDNAGSIGQVQWVFRGDLNQFPNVYAVNEDLSNPGPVVTPLPTEAEYFSALPGRAVQDATADEHGFTDLPAGFHHGFGDKYDYSTYEYLHRAHGAFGSKYGAWMVLPSNETLSGGPTKQNLSFTGNLVMMEAYSGHLDNAITMPTPKGTASNRLFGPYYMRFNKFGGAIQTADDMYADAVAAGTSFGHFYDNEAQLVASGYVPSTARGTVQVQVNGVTGNPKTAWVILSDPGKNVQYSSQGLQYWADISSTGTATITGVAPGTYRMSCYVLGQFGELRQEGVVVNANQVTVVPPVNFVAENFGSSAPVFTIGTPDRSSHEFLRGHDANGHDDREFWGTWNYWADFQANSGAVVYNATSGPAGAATNNLDKWNYNHWQTFNPGLYAGIYNANDQTTDGYKYNIPTYVNTLTGHAGANGTTTKTPPWVVHFASPSNASSSTYAVLSVGLAATEASYTVSLNGTPLTWGAKNKSDAAIRSGLSGYYQWVAFQWDASLLKPAGQDNTITIAVNSGQGDEDDALRLELTNATADPAVRGWNDYEYIYKTTDTLVNDAVPNP